MTEKFDTEFDAIRAALVSKPELTKDLNVSIRNLLRLTEHLQNSGLRMERYGHWEEIRDAYGKLEGWLCKCGREVKSKDNYCPNCGAKMDGGGVDKHD